jgi:hypothetical protein
MTTQKEQTPSQGSPSPAPTAAFSHYSRRDWKPCHLCARPTSPANLVQAVVPHIEGQRGYLLCDYCCQDIAACRRMHRRQQARRRA